MANPEIRNTDARPRITEPEARGPAPQPPAAETRPAPEAPARRRRRGLRLVLLLLGPLLALAIGAYFYITGGRYVSTDNAYTQSNIVAISPDISGEVTEVLVEENDWVEAGDVLFRIDDERYRIAVAQAEAALASAAETVDALKAMYRQRQAELAREQENVAFYEREFERAQRLVQRGVAPESRLDEARRDIESSRQQVIALRAGIEQIEAALGGDINTPVEQTSRYLQAKANLDKVQVDLADTVVRAPSAGVVGNIEDFRPGDYVRAGEPAFSLVELQNLWIEANFKETQLTHVRPGQPVRVEVDIYPGWETEGVVGSLSPATGAEFSLLPPQNATGNWVKVVQRVPVRILIERHEDDPPLRAGLSTEVSIDTEHHRELPGPLARMADAVGLYE